jgi:hypothetical protein
MMGTVTLGARVAVAKEVIWSDVTGSIVVLHLGSGVYSGIEGVGSAIWKDLQEPRTVREIIDRLLQAYDVSPELCERQTLAFLELLLEKNVIVVNSHVAGQENDALSPTGAVTH